jgi:hypothetical protein
VSEGPQPPEPGPGPPAPDAGPAAPRPRPRSHRASTPVSDAVRRFLAPLAAVTAVVVVIVLLLVLNGPGHDSGPGPALQSPPAVATTTATAAPVRTTPAPAPKRTSHRASPRPTLPVEEPPATAEPVAQKLPVTVLNNSRRTGLAHRAAAQLEAGGWPIRQVGNFTGRIPVSTVYYAPGQAASAQALAEQYEAVRRVHPRFRGLPGSGLTLVVTREWPA